MTETIPELDRTLARECRLNLLWLLAGSGGGEIGAEESRAVDDQGPKGGRPLWRGKALHVAVPGLEVESALSAFFEDVETVPIEAFDPGGGWRPAWRDPEPSLPFPDASFRLVSVYGHALSTGYLRELRRVLMPGGILYLGVRNRWWYGRLRPSRPETRIGGRFGGIRLKTRVRKAGFKDIRTYWVDPSLEFPRDLVPAEPQALRALPIIDPSDWAGDSFRARLLRFGLSPLAFPAHLVLAHG